MSISEEKKKRELKNIILRLHEGEKPETLRNEFRNFLQHVKPDEISRMEDELIQEEKVSREQIQKLCDIHLAVFKDNLQQHNEKVSLDPDHPIFILKEEHTSLISFAQDLIELTKTFNNTSDELNKLITIINHFKESENHYTREENVLFPYLEKYGISEPPAIMWSEHDQIRSIKKKIYSLVESDDRHNSLFKQNLLKYSQELAHHYESHFFKENNILFPTALNVIKKEEWLEIRMQFDEIGYCCFTPELPKMKEIDKESEEYILKKSSENTIKLNVGDLELDQLQGIFNALPVDISFVDTEDKVKFFNEPIGERIFPRSRAVIGRSVQNCHPQKSVHIVNQILDDFKNGKRDVAEFWINMKGKTIHIRYFPVQNKKGAYIGCLEVSQDITNIKKLTGEKRLLD